MSVELDYAFLAQWARVNGDGTLTAVDASFLRVSGLPGSLFPMAIAGRVRFLGEPYSADLLIELEGPGASVAFSATVTADETSSYGDGRRHSLFALTTQVPIIEPGEYRVTISLDGKRARVLIFTVATRSEPD